MIMDAPVNILAICRICLMGGDMTNIYETREKSENAVAEIMTIILNLELSPDDNLPPNVCSECLSRLRDAYKLRLTSNRTKEILLSWQLKPHPVPDEVAVAEAELDIIDDLREESSTYEQEEHIIEDVETDLIFNSPIDSSNEVEEAVAEQIDETTSSNIKDYTKVISEEFIITEEEELNVYAETDIEEEIIEVEVPEPAPAIKSPREKITYFSCGICQMSFTRQLTLTHHIRRHNNEKPVVCSYCSKAFVSQFEMKRHMRIHVGEKPYPCNYCDKKFSDYSSRKKHHNLHTGNRPYSCSLCSKAFAYSNVLQAHMTTHTGEKKHGCEKCGKKFAQAHHLRAHMRAKGIHTDLEEGSVSTPRN